MPQAELALLSSDDMHVRIEPGAAWLVERAYAAHHARAQRQRILRFLKVRSA